LAKISPASQENSLHLESRFQLKKYSKLFIRTHHETLSATMRVNDPNCAPIIVERRDPARAESGFNDFVNDDFPILH
jgi:hypothetical protein